MPWQDITGLPLSGREVRTLFPGLAAHTMSEPSSAAAGVASAVIGEIADRLTLTRRKAA
jgi:hypothetical protein